MFDDLVAAISVISPLYNCLLDFNDDNENIFRRSKKQEKDMLIMCDRTVHHGLGEGWRWLFTPAGSILMIDITYIKSN